MKQLNFSSKSNALNCLDILIAEPNALSTIQHLDSKLLLKIIDTIGLEDAAPIISLITSQQLNNLFDEDLWFNEASGLEEKFDPRRFALWLEVMSEMGSSFSAQKLIELDDDYVFLGLSQLILVIDGEVLISRHLEKQGGFENDLEEKMLAESPYHEFHPYWVFSKYIDSWETVLSLLITLENEHHDYFIRLMERCECLSSEYVEDNGGLYNILSAEEKLFSDVSFERETIRENQGHVLPQKGAIFLKMIRDMKLEELVAQSEEDSYTLNYFNNLSVPQEVQSNTRTEELAIFLDLVTVAGVLPQKEVRPLLSAKSKNRIQEELDDLFNGHKELYNERLSQISYLANTLIASCPFEGRRFREIDAVDASVAISNLGMDYLLNQKLSASVSLKNCSPVKFFKIGWQLLYSRVILYSAHRLEAAIHDSSKKITDSFIKKHFLEISQKLKINISRGIPWDTLAMFDFLETIYEQKDVYMLKMLIAECPRFEGHFISTLWDIQEVESYLTKFDKLQKKGPVG